ncbi:ATP-binding protein [Streptomyces sp. RB6PN25]|uniref:histidine kinase n=1 Tax=Streptomyces humicola TaxID=2953240 RepID=A0ABT1PNA3_9ACTN|nr:ATP-binding protein [Streptomyces humicola]MCQ4079153.1 ATP-binding protein [Streptomyces humicola]
MSELPAPDARTGTGRLTVRRHGKRPARGLSAAGGLRSRLVTICVLPAATVAVLAAAATTYLTTSASAPEFGGMTAVVLIVAAAACLAVIVAAARQASAVARAIRLQSVNADSEVQQRISQLRSSVAVGVEELQRLAEQGQRGQHLTLPEETVVTAPGTPFAQLEQDLRQMLRAAQSAVVRAASHRQVEVSINLARRLQTLVGRAIKELDELEREVEDPVLLKGLFSVDHLATRVRRQAESLAVLGGAVSRRFSSPVNLYTVLRSAVAEVEQYARVKVIPPVEGAVRGHAVADVIHLIAELVENATMFSPPETQVSLRAQKVAAGLALEIEDRGVGMPPQDRQRMNNLLVAPERFDIGDLLKDGRIGLFVVSTLARRYGIAVQLQSNIYGGTQAVVVLPHALLGDASAPEGSQAQPDKHQPVQQGPEPVRGSHVPEAPAAHRTRVAAPALDSLPSATTTHAEVREPIAPLSAPAERAGVHAAEAETTDTSPANGDHPSRLPTREPGAQMPAAPPTAATPPKAGDDPVGRPGPDHAARPPLPHRSGSYMAPELRQAREARPEPVAGHTPGLLAAFRDGLSRADEQNGPLSETDRTS